MTESITFDDAQQRFTHAFSPIGPPERIALARALGRVLAAPVHAISDQPPTDQSAMDGYAVRHADTHPGASLHVQQRCYAGDTPTPLERGCATRIFTGSVIPPGADTVVMQEDAREIDNCVFFDAPVAPYVHIRYRGEEVRAGQRLINTGVRIQASHLGIIAAQGIDSIKVRPILKVGILTSGDELVSAGAPRSATQSYNSNAPMLTALVSTMGAIVTHVRHAKDSVDELIELLSEMLAECDLILTTGGASVGEKDLVGPALRAIGATFLVNGVNMKPGKPISLARSDTSPIVLLPGNPGAVFTTFTLLVTPLIRRLQGRAECLPPVVRLPIDLDATADPTRERFVRVRLDASLEQPPLLRVAAQQGAGNLATLADTNGLARLERGRCTTLGETASYYDFDRWLV